MKFPRSKKLLFANNKGGVGKTALAFNCAMSFAKRGYKTVLVDLDSQCNLSRLAMGDDQYADTFSSKIPAKCQEVGVAIFDPLLVDDIHAGTKGNIEKSKEEFAHLFEGIRAILAAY